MGTKDSIILVAVIALVNLVLRFLPAIVLKGRETPKVIAYLGKVLPYAVMGMLVIYCLRNVTFTSLSGFVPEAAAIAVIAALYLWRRNSILSIISGTAVYMILRTLVF